MKKRVVIALTAISMALMSLTGCQSVTKNYGGKTTVKLEPNQKLEEITWKDDSLWYLTRPMKMWLKLIHFGSRRILEFLKER